MIRVASDVGDIRAGEVPPEGDFDRRYVLNSWIAYLHIVPGVVYLLGAPFPALQEDQEETHSLPSETRGEAFGVGIEQSFGAAFPIAFAMLSICAEIGLRLRPDIPA